MRRGTLAATLVALTLDTGTLLAGAYTGSTTIGGTWGPSVVVHTYGYTGASGTYTARICAAPSADPVLVPAIQSTIALWNARTVSNNNCSGPCLMWREPDQTGPYFFERTLLHEIGHCGIGLTEVFNTLPSDVPHDATNTVEEVNITAGSDGVLGSSDDVVTVLPGARVVHWFRVADNHPFVRDGAVIDKLTYSRNFNNLPTGHNWPASGNKDVAVILGVPGLAMSVMFGRSSPRTSYSAFIGDDINTLEFAETGIDESAVTTADNYTTQLVFEPNCNQADIEVRFVELGMRGVSGVCSRSLDLISPVPDPPRHYKLHSDPAFGVRSLISLNRAFDWPVSTLPFADGFESTPDHFAFWSSVVSGQ